MGRTLILAVMMTAAAAAQAQTPAPRVNTGDLRHHIFVMEGALARAVQFGAVQVNREMRVVSPELFRLDGDTSARGVYLEDYGVYFDVGVPILRPSMLWNWKVISERDERNTRELIEDLKRMAATERDPAKRRSLEATIARLELGLEPAGGTANAVMPMPGAAPGQSGPGVNVAVGPQMVLPNSLPGETNTTSPAPAPGATPSPRIVPGNMVLKDPNRAYTDAVQRALIDAMIDYSAPIIFKPNEWLTVAARDNAPRDIFAPQDPFDEVVTIILRIKGEDLAAYRRGAIDREEAKKRVQVKEF